MATDRDFQYDLRPQLQPLLLPVCAFAAGIVAADAAGVPVGQAAIGCAAAILTAIAARCVGTGRLAYLALLMAVALAGSLRTAVSRAAMDARPLRQLVESGRVRAGNALELVGTVEDVPARHPSGARIGIHISSVRVAEGDWIDVDGRAAVGVRISDPRSGTVLDAMGLERGTPIRIAVEASDELAFRNPGVETLRARIRRSGFDLAAHASDPQAIAITGPSDGCPVLRRLSGIRVWGLAEIDAAFAPRTAGVLRALLLGDESHLDESTAECYRQSGAYHVLVISGAHVALLAGLCVWVTGRVSRSPSSRLLAAAGPAWLYALVLGGPAPVIRAALALTVAFLAPLVGRRAPPPNTLALAALVVLAIDPAAIRDPSFQLTFAAVAAIVCIAAPVAERMADIGRWRTHRAAPYPPICSGFVRVLAESLFWDERRFRTGQRTAAIRFGASKAGFAVWMNRVRAQGIFRRVAVGVWVAVAVQWALAPLAVTSFGRLTLVGTIWALAVEALLGGALVAGLGFLTMRGVAPAASAPLEWIADRLVVWSNAVASDAPGGWPVAEPSGWSAIALWTAPVAVAVVAALVSGWHPVPRSRAELVRRPSQTVWRFASGAVSVVLVASLGVSIRDQPADGRLHVLFLDVGQGDAAFVRFPDGTTMLIDAGGRPRFDEPLGFDNGRPFFAEQFDIGDRVVTALLLAQGISHLDWIVATHGDIDHVGGFGAVLRRLSVGRVVIGNGPDAAELRFARSAENLDKRVVRLGAGDALEVGGARLEVVWPSASAPDGNDGSLVFRLVFGERSLFFTGDIEAAGEGSLLRLAAENGWNLRSDVLKVPHHGSRGASSPAFVAAVAPRWAVVSAPRQSPYGHPHAEAIRRLREAGASVVQTGIDGAVGFTTDGHEIVMQRIAEPGTQLLPPDFDHGARIDRTNLPGGPK